MALPACLLVFVFSWSIMSQPSLSHFRLQPLHMFHGRSSQAPPRLNKRSSSEHETRIATRHCLCAYQARSCNINWSEQCFGSINFPDGSFFFLARVVVWVVCAPYKWGCWVKFQSYCFCLRNQLWRRLQGNCKQTQRVSHAPWGQI